MRTCPKCFTSSQNGPTCAACGLVFEKYHATLHPPLNAKNWNELEEVPPQQAILSLGGLPLMALFAWFIHAVPVFQLLASMMTSWIHEFGHTLVLWCSSHFALPTVLVTVSLTSEKSIPVFIVIIFASVFGAYRLFLKKLYFLSLNLFVCALMTIYLTFIASNTRAEEWMIYSGIGAQFWLSTLFIISYYYRLPKKEGWGGLRFVLPTYGMVCFIETMIRFYHIRHGLDDLPMGSAMGGPDDSNGDLNRLIGEFGWTEKSILHSYLNLGSFCTYVLVTHYLVFSYLYLKTKITKN